jgi:hypothetical protein
VNEVNQEQVEQVADDLAKPVPKAARKPKVKKVAKKVVKKVKKVAAEEAVEPKKVKKNGKAAPGLSDDSGLVTVAALAAEADISPQSARVKLRAAELDRGEGRWKWEEGSKALKEARKVLNLT